MFSEWLNSIDNDIDVLANLPEWKGDYVLMAHSLMLLKRDSGEYDSADEENRALARPASTADNR